MNEYKMLDAMMDLGLEGSREMFRWIGESNPEAHTVDEMVAMWNEKQTGAQDAVITIKRGRSYDGGFNAAKMTSDELDHNALWQLGDELMIAGGLQRLGGYEIVADHVIQALGEAFTVAQLRAYCAEIEARRAQQDAEMVLCDCGHRVPANQVMNASLGTSCPDCYDRMSDC